VKTIYGLPALGIMPPLGARGLGDGSACRSALDPVVLARTMKAPGTAGIAAIGDHTSASMEASTTATAMSAEAM
jgi:hypothetical protein